MDVLRFINTHPLTRKHKFHAIRRWLAWQIGSRLVPGPVAVSFVNEARLLVLPGMTGATGNVYCGLHEFEDMAFLLHFLRPDDKFIDIGSNIGSYTVLASKAVGCQTIAIEPIPETICHLQNNVDLNGIFKQVKIHQVALGREPGMLYMTQDQDTMNHVISGTEKGEYIEVQVETLDKITEDGVALIKIDVEGYESEVLAGGVRTLSDVKLQAIIMELNGSGSRYGFDEKLLQQNMLEKGFLTYSYNPFARELVDLKGALSVQGNTLFLRDVEFVVERLQAAPEYRVGNHRF